MKKTTLAILFGAALFLGSSDAFAQGKWGADSAECVKYMSYYKENYKNKAYDDAVKSWRKAYELCPATASQNMLIDGTVLMRHLISKNASNPEYRSALVDTLLTLHDVRAENYPNYAVTALNNKGLDMFNYLKDDDQKLYEGYEGIIENNGAQTRAEILLFDLQAAVNLYQSGSLEADAVINAYQRNADLLEEVPAKNDIEEERNAKIEEDLGSLFAASKVASCDNLIELLTPRMDANPDDLKVATDIARTMNYAEDCTSNDLYLRAVSTMYRLEPSANSAYYLYRLYSAVDNVEEAVKYMQEAISREDSDLVQDTEWTYELATYYYKHAMMAEAFEAANFVAENSEELKGKAYFLIGNVWGSTRCGGDEIASRAPFWVACDYMNRAKSADATLTDSANDYISQYSAYFPKAEEAFMYDVVDGQTYTVVCNGMRATTTVRTVK